MTEVNKIQNENLVTNLTKIQEVFKKTKATFILSVCRLFTSVFKDIVKNLNSDTMKDYYETRALKFC